MTDELSVEASGETVGEAKWAAMRELERAAPGLDRDAVRFEVLAEGERGLLGVGTTPARVRATAPRPPAREELPAVPAGSTDAELALAVVEHIARGIGASFSAQVDETSDEVLVTLTGSDLGVLIGRHGQTIDAIQYLANAIAHHRLGDERRRVVVDASGYRARRTATLEAQAERAAERASATGRRVELEPMTAVERKIVHEFLKDDPQVETASEGTEPNRFVVVLPRHAAD